MVRSSSSILWIPLATCLFLGGCAAPRKQVYQQPKTPAPPAWHTGLPDQPVPAAGAAPATADVKWADFFLDDKLRQVVKLAIEKNLDLRMATLNVEKVQAQYRIQRAQQFPRVTAGASGDAYRVPKDMTNNDKGYTYETMQVGAQVSSWELDLFGRIRSLKEQALEQYLSSEQGRASAQISLVASVAAAYLTLASDHDSLRLAQSTLDAQQATYDMVSRTRDLGIKSDLEVGEAKSQVEAAQVDLVKYTGWITLDENALNLLVGAEVPDSLLPAGLVTGQGLKDISAGLPSEVLLRRPDILSAEHQLKAAYANIGAARAAFFPTVTLTAGGGITSGALTQLFSPRALTWEFAPQVTLPIFDAGARKASYRVAEVDRDTAVAEYQKSIQTAFREVSDALNQRTRLREQETAQQALVDTLAENFHLTEARYKSGLDNYLNVLVAQRSLYSGQLALLNIRLARLSNLVTLYKVLGGGA